MSIHKGRSERYDSYLLFKFPSTFQCWIYLHILECPRSETEPKFAILYNVVNVKNKKKKRDQKKVELE
jgi:hypothetical protein